MLYQLSYNPVGVMALVGTEARALSRLRPVLPRHHLLPACR